MKLNICSIFCTYINVWIKWFCSVGWLANSFAPGHHCMIVCKHNSSQMQLRKFQVRESCMERYQSYGLADHHGEDVQSQLITHNMKKVLNIFCSQTQLHHNRQYAKLVRIYDSLHLVPHSRSYSWISYDKSVSDVDWEMTLNILYSN